MRPILTKFVLIFSLTGCTEANDAGGGGASGGGDIPAEAILATAVVVGGVYAVTDFLNRRAESANDTIRNSDPIAARRAFSGPNEHDPSDFEVFGMVAFPAAPTTANFSRFVMICEAYMQGISPVSEGAAISSNFALTVWPVTRNVSDQQIGFKLVEACVNATTLYDATASRDVIDAANRSGIVEGERGPYLIAWTSDSQLGTDTRHVAFMDMSWVNRPSEAAAYVRDWRELIVSDPTEWETVWNAGRFNRFGDQFYAFVGPFFE